MTPDVSSVISVLERADESALQDGATAYERTLEKEADTLRQIAGSA